MGVRIGCGLSTEAEPRLAAIEAAAAARRGLEGEHADLAIVFSSGAHLVEPVPGVDLEAYKAQLIERFSNPEVRDTVARLCAESSDRIPKWLVPVIRHNLRSGGEIERSTAIVAAWARYAEGVDEDGEPIEVVDTGRAEERTAAARRYPDEQIGRAHV